VKTTATIASCHTPGRFFAPCALCKMCAVLALFGLTLGYAQTAEAPDAATEYNVHWLAVTSAISDIAQVTLSLDSEKPDPKSAAELKKAADELENAVSALMRSVPTVEGARLHVFVLPRLIEVVGASRELLHVIQGGDHAEIAASLDWLDNALLQLEKSVHAELISSPVAETGGKAP
jgi:hypothetical protein